MTNKGFDRDRYYFRNGSLYANSDRNATEILIESEADLQSDVLKQMEPGTIAHLPGYTKTFELSPNFEWIEKTGGSGSGSGSGSGTTGENVISTDDSVVLDGMNAEERVAAET